MWVARCPRLFCTNAEGFGPQQDGVAGGLTGQAFHCREVYGGCGLTCAADWPPNVAQIERLLSVRPVPSTRNWLPGEPVVNLLCENIERGLADLGEPIALPDGSTVYRLEGMLPELTTGGGL